MDYEYELGDLPWAGNVTKITRKIVGNDVFYGTCLTYTRNGELWIVTEQTWEEDEFGQPFNEQTVSITEFRGSGRGRYLTRQRDPASPTQVLAATTTWYDYDGDEIYGDYEVDVVGQDVTTTQIGVTEAGLAQVDYNGSGMSYFHSDQIGSTRLLTDSPHTIEDSYVYTAFGEKVHADGTIGTRYRYAGAWGYQNNSEFAAPDSAFDGIHVGHRYYSPSIGRFLQRDPIGIIGGFNVYEYVASSPLSHVDPEGLIGPGLHGRLIWPSFRSKLDPNRGHLPILDYGPAHDITVICATVVSFVSPATAGARVVTAAPKAVAAIRTGWVGRHLVRIRNYIRYDRPHHGRPSEWDGKIIRWFRERF